MQWLIDRAKERSTWLGLVTVATSLGVAVTPEQVQAIVTGGAAVGGLVAAFTKG